VKYFSRSEGPPTRDYHVLNKCINAAIQACKDYEAHIKTIAPKLPEPTRVFVMSSAYGNHNSHDCPHDSWLMNIILDAEVCRDNNRRIDLTIRLLGAFHDRILTFKYINVTEFNIEIKKSGNQNVGDWLNDEFDIAEQGFVSHEILWQFGKPWKIISECVEFSAEDRVQN
jgi:hypothetical protein